MTHSPAPPLPPTYSPPQVARRLGCKPEKVIAWIRAGRLQAMNIASEGCIRPRYRITPEALAEFEASLLVVAPKRPTRRRATAKRRFFQ